jgi:hypothetical protein
MSDLLEKINVLLDDVIASENNTMNIYAKLAEAYEELGNEKFADVAGLYKPNFFVFMRYIKAHIGELDNIQFAIESRITDKDKKESENAINRWNEAIKKIPQKDEFTLEGIETWHILHHEMIANYADMHNPLFKEEAIKLIASGFNLGFNTDRGTGSIRVTDDGLSTEFIIELWQNMKKVNIYKNSLDDVVDWLIRFCETL